MHTGEALSVARGTSVGSMQLERRNAMGRKAQLHLWSCGDQCQRFRTVTPVAAPALNHAGARTAFLSAIRLGCAFLGFALLGFIVLVPTATIAAEAQANRMVVEYVPPTNPAHQALYERLKERRVLEKLQEIFSPFQLPVELKLRTLGCDGVSNAWYGKPRPGSSEPPSVNVCYEYLAEIQQSVPPETTPAGITPMDAMVGQFFYVFAHEMGHAMFDVLGIPVFGREEDAADDFATYLMLRFGDEESRALITGAAYSYRKYIQGSQVTVPLAAFSDAHSAPAQRFFNLLCTAYGSDPTRYGDFVEKGYLPKGRAGSCMREYNTTAFAFRELIAPHVDKEMAKQVLGKTWLSEHPMPQQN
jgi:hypothetical protein